MFPATNAINKIKYYKKAKKAYIPTPSKTWYKRLVYNTRAVSEKLFIFTKYFISFT